ncbi:hypothetical protein ACIA8K_26095 [Catenuloplanes sp. NPDC051500]|uniref:hypothetical protein n=1 Tax=Catenuloplanes sp. NPDC051500 TaxID=3363959 RepID=UPI003791574F
MGALYDFSVWARVDAGGTPLTVTLHDAAGQALGRPLTITATGGGWAKYTGTLRADRTTDAGRLTVRAGGAVALDEISLFPRDTFKNHGLRKDLAEKVAALAPGFVRFPGGCLVNTGSHQGYDAASNYERARSYQWKDTVGPVEERAANKNFWGYNQSYGLGYFEYFQFSEDIGAMPLPVVPALVTGCGQNRATEDEALLQRHIQDTLDLIEFANGPATSTWGGLRARMGHPAPFRLTHVAVDFSAGADAWSPFTGRGAWSVVDGAYVQSDTAAQDTMVRGADITATDYDYSVKATKISGAEGFLVGFGLKETGAFYWWNLGGWNNTQGAVEKGVGGAKEQILTKPNTVETGRTYDLTVQVRGNVVKLLLDGVEWGGFTDDVATSPVAQVVTRDERAGELIVKVVNAQDTPAVTRLDLGGVRVRDRARMTVITGDPAEQNTRSAEPIQPVTSTVTGISSDFTRTFPANSVTFLRLRIK